MAKAKEDKSFTPEVDKSLSLADRRKSIETQVISSVLKKYGNGSATMANNMGYVSIPRVSTGVFILDYGLGGGFPKGRINVIWGDKSTSKSTIVLKTIGNAQKMDVQTNKYMWELKKPDEGIPHNVAYVDIEGAYDNKWAEYNGVDTSSLHYFRPRCSEEAADIIESLVRSGSFDIIALDSLAAMTPKAEIEGDMEDQNVGLAARINNKMFRKVQSAINKIYQEDKNIVPTLLVVNQLRQKIGCFNYDSKVLMADGSLECIGKIVNQKISRPVLSFNPITKEVESKKIVGWHNNGQSDKFLHVKVNGGASGSRGFRCTPEHVIYTPNGEIGARDLKVGSKVLVNGFKYYNDQQFDLILGSMLGDGSLRFEKHGNRGHLRVGHGKKQKEYCEWKANSFGQEIGVTKKGSVWFDSERSEEFMEFNDIIKKKGVVFIPDRLIDQLTPKSIAIWYQDDGTFSGSYERWGHGKSQIAATLLKENCGLKVAAKICSLGLGYPTFIKGKGFLWSSDESKLFQRGIGKYVHPSMRYKLKSENRKFNWFSKVSNPIGVLYPATVVSIEDYIPKSKLKSFRYDITVDGNHNYFVSDVLVHNCMFGDPSVKPGGLGQDFYSSVEVRFYGNKVAFFDGDEKKLPKWTEFGFKVMKNKVSPPKIEGDYKMALADEPSGEFKTGEVVEKKEVIEFCERLNVLRKEGKSWKMFDEDFDTKSKAVGHYFDDPQKYLILKRDLISMLCKKQ